MHCRHQVVVLILVAIFLVVNKFLIRSWHQGNVSKDLTFLPTDRLLHKDTHFPSSLNVTFGKKDRHILIDTIENRKEAVKIVAGDHVERKPNNGNNFVFNKNPVNEALDDYSLYLTNTKDRDIQNPFTNKHKYVYSLNNKYACNGNVFVVALIHSSPNNIAERNRIRNSWGAVRFHLGATIASVFLLAQVGNEGEQVQAKLVEESKQYRDVIQGNFIDSYKNLTHKNIMGLHWVQHYCNNTKFILKTDDDTMVDIFHLIKFLFQKSPDGNLENFLYCSMFKNHGPRRDTSDKWFVTLSDYPYTKYPPYCEGFAYIMSYDVSAKLYDASSSVKFYWIDDVFVTGFLALKAGIYHREMERGHSYILLKSEYLPKHVPSSMFLLAKYDYMTKNWDKAWSDIKTVNRIPD